jgi:hypothetical protein
VTKHKDFIRATAERELGHAVPDEAWTPEARNLWKMFLHGRNYGQTGVKISLTPRKIEETK